MSDERSRKRLLKRLFKRDSVNAEEPHKLAQHNTANVPARPAEHVSFHSSSVIASTPTVSVNNQSTTGPSALIPAPSEKTSQRGTNYIERDVGVMGKETAVAANPTQKQDTDTREAESTPASLWDKAYDSLKQEQSNLLSRYEDLLSRVLIKAEANDLSAPNQGEDSGDVSNRIPQHNTTARQEILKQITELGLKHMEDKKVKVTILGHEIGLQDSIGKVGETVDWARKYIQDAIKDVPYASAVMAGISLILPLLKNPAAIDTASREGFTYVTSQTRYYIEMESLLLPEDMKPDLKSDLTERVLDLYKLVIEFQVQSVMRFYRSRTKNYFRSIINYDSWKDKLEHLQKEESSLEEKFEKALSSTSLQQLKKLAREAEGSRKTLDNILNNIQELVFISQDQKAILERTERHLSNAEDRRCRETLQATDPSLDKERIEEDKGGLLKDSYSWVLSNDDFQNWRDASYSQLLWIKGDPGKGKTMLLCGIIDELSKMATDKTNISFFFCQATNSRINNATAVLRGLIYMLVRQQPSLITHVRDGCFEGENAWFALLRVFNSILEDPHLHRTYLIIDALDECTADLSRLLHLLVQKSPACSHVRWIVSSRNWPGIEKDLNDTTQIKLRLELNEDILTAAVDSFIQYKTNKLAEENNYSPRLRDDVQHHLVSKANGTFLWAALVCKNLARVPARNVRKKLENFPSGLDELYQRMLNQISESDDAEFCKHLLDITTTVYRPVTLDELASFIDLPEDVAGDYETLKEIIESCGSFLTLRERKISLVHQSAKDFLLQKASAKIFLGHAENIHHFIFSRSLQVISGILRRDIFNIRSPGFPIDQVKTPYPDPLAAAQYSCVYWVDHLLDYHAGQTEGWSKDLQDGGMVDEFLRTKYLYWFEALALLRCLSEGALAISRLTDLAQRVAKGSQLLSHIQYARRFILYFKGAIEQSPLQVYTSAPVFSPACSLIRGLFKKEEPQWIMNKPAMEDSWSACLQTLEGHSHGVSSVVFSHDSRLLASTSDDKTLKLWDATNGQCLQTLEGHSYRVKSVVFSHDSRLLASALLDKTVKLWDATNGQCLQTLEGHSHSVWLVVFSHDSRLLASVSGNNTVKLWDATNGQCLQTLEGHSQSVRLVVFSHDSRLLASVSSDKTVKLWDATNGQCLQTLEGHSDWVNYVVFSHNSRLLASASSDKTVKLWDATNGQCLQTLEGHSDSVYSIVFSHDSSLLASASRDETVKLWDTTNGQCLQTLEGHSHSVSSVVFSHDSRLLASASLDHTVKIWDAINGQCLQTLEGHSDWVNCVVFSHDSSLLASASRDKTVKLWGATNGQFLQTLEGHSHSVDPVVFSHDSRLLASVLGDDTVKLWDATNGQCLQTLEGHSHSVYSIVLSHDSRLLASASDDETVKLWDATNGQCLQTFEGHSHSVYFVVFSHDSRLLACASDETVKLWDTTNGQCLQTLEGHSDSVNSIVFSHDSRLLASASEDKTVKLWGATNGQFLQTLEGHSDSVNSVVFSHDSRLLASASDDKTVKLWDATNCQCLQTLEGHSGWVNCVVFSHDSGRLASASRDKTVKLWDATNGQCLQTLEGHSHSVRSVVFSHDSSLLASHDPRLLASSSDDETVKVWDPNNGQCLQIIHAGRVGSMKSFDITNSYLKMDRGNICLSLSSGKRQTKINPELPRFQGYGVSSDGIWITWNSDNLLWLPPEYRPVTTAVGPSNISIGCDSGRVLIFKFDSQRLLRFLAGN